MQQAPARGGGAGAAADAAAAAERVGAALEALSNEIAEREQVCRPRARPRVSCCPRTAR